MAEAPDDPLIDPDIPERRPSREHAAGRRQGIPEARGGKRQAPLIKDISTKKAEMKDFKTAEQLEERRQLEETDLQWDDEGGSRPVPAAQAKGEAPAEPPIVPSPDDAGSAPWQRREGHEPAPLREDELPASTTSESVESPEPPSPPAREELPGAALAEAQRKPATAPKSLRATDFEPKSWASSTTPYDWPEEDEAPVRWRDCLAKPVSGLKAFCRKSNGLEVVSMSLVLVVVAASFFFFRSLVHSKEQAESLPTSETLALPVQVDGLTMTSVESFWRPVRPGDIAKPEQLLLPQVDLVMNGSGFIRVFFREPPENGEVRGRIRGDSVTLEPSAGDVLSVTCSEGYENPMDLIEYAAGQSEGWKVEIFTAPSANAPFPDAWKLFTEFLMSSNRKDEG